MATKALKIVVGTGMLLFAWVLGFLARDNSHAGGPTLLVLCLGGFGAGFVLVGVLLCISAVSTFRPEDEDCGDDPVLLDGRSIVILRRRDGIFRQHLGMVTSGHLVQDGGAVWLVTPHERRAMTEQELSSVRVVHPDTVIEVCHGFDLFMVER